MEYITLAAFVLLLFLCLALNQSILIALALGLVLFSAYGVKKGFSIPEILRLALSGVHTVKNILITFVLIGVMTALWRAAGVIPAIVCHAAALIRPPVYLLMTFLLNCMISFLTGTAFGAAATMGVICSAIGASLGVSPLLTGGAVLSGVYFGDRCSPVSTSALLVATLTGTDVYANIRRMLRSAAMPFLLSCAIYAAAGFMTGSGGEAPDLTAVFESEFCLSVIALLPAGLLLLLAALKVNVKLSMTASILAAAPICVFLQGTPLTELPGIMLFGYTSGNAEIAAMLNGGGVASMLNVAAIVCISSAYSGIFQKTGLLDSMKRAIHRLSTHASPVLAAAITSAVTGMIACNQTLTIMLTEQLCRETEPDSQRFALTLEDTAVVIAPLIPWSIAGAVPLASVGAPGASVLAACFLYLLPVCSCLSAFRRRSAG